MVYLSLSNNQNMPPIKLEIVTRKKNNNETDKAIPSGTPYFGKIIHSSPHERPTHLTNQESL